jgi:mono/diheme cytochrome c family protein
MPVWGYEFWIEEGADIAAERGARLLIDRIIEHMRDFQQSTDGQISGATTYAQYCSACHGTRAEGDGPVAEAMRVTMPNLRSLAERNDGDFPADAVASYIDGRRLPQAHGERYMPVWGEVFSSEVERRPNAVDPQIRIDALVDFLRDIQYR